MIDCLCREVTPGFDVLGMDGYWLVVRKWKDELVTSAWNWVEKRTVSQSVSLAPTFDAVFIDIRSHC
jgi:hypothetical protein